MKMPFLKLKRADLIDFGYRITINLTADFAGIDRIKKTTNEKSTGFKLNLKSARPKAKGQRNGDMSSLDADYRDAADALKIL